ncbi:MAG: hypothetical protein OXH14_08920 [Alphaproteobacteria bacterium]|nr:hypothetical protein [Alphaproteobacteria bacterium]
MQSACGKGCIVAPQPVLLPRRWDWDHILLAGHDPLEGEPLPGRTLVLAPHPEPEELEAVRAAAPDRAGARVLVEPIWLPGLRSAVPEVSWNTARMAAGRVVADLWRATTSAGADAA